MRVCWVCVERIRDTWYVWHGDAVVKYQDSRLECHRMDLSHDKSGSCRFFLLE